MDSNARPSTHTIAIHDGHAVLLTGIDGHIPSGSQMGLYFRDTRVVSRWCIHTDGKPWTCIDGRKLNAGMACTYLTNPELRSKTEDICAGTIELTVTRHMNGGLHEDLCLTNYGAETHFVVICTAIASDFADIFEVKAGQAPLRGSISTEWDTTRLSMLTRYTNGDFSRAVRVTCQNRLVELNISNGGFRLAAELPAGESRRVCLLYDFADGSEWINAPKSCSDSPGATKTEQLAQEWRDSVTRLETPCCGFATTFNQAVDDLASLRLPIPDTGASSFVPAGGLPWFVALFGRDCLISALQASIVHPQFALGALRALGRRQAKDYDDYRDAQPGKILHELRLGELAHLGLIPHSPYYGTADATPLYLITLHQAWMCTGDRALIEEHLETAERCLSWIDDSGDLDGDGFQEYQTRSSAGYENQGWKDSGRAVVGLDGTNVDAPKALCELQGYVYDAWLRMAQIYDGLAREQDAARLRGKAHRLYRQFNDTFWNEAEGFYAFALDGKKKPVLTVASNPGHCLWSGIVPPDRAARVVARLMQSDMLSRWGIRTLSKKHVCFNPHSYQLGSVWPHDNGFISVGMRRYGFDREALEVARAILLAAETFERNQLPELYAGITDHLSPYPVRYPGANTPQAWAAGTVLMLLQMMLGFQPDAPRGKLFFDPKLPEWLPEIVLRNLKSGENVFDIRFRRKNENTEMEILRGPASAIERRRLTWTMAL